MYSQNAYPEPVTSSGLPVGPIVRGPGGACGASGPCRTGIVNRPWQRPWPSSTIVNHAAARARLLLRLQHAGPRGPHRSRGRPRPGSGAPAPAMLSRRDRRACSRSTPSASATTRRVDQVRGRASIASTITAACSTNTPPVGQRFPDRLVRLTQPTGQPGQPVSLGAGHLRGVGPPARHRRGALVEADLDHRRRAGPPGARARSPAPSTGSAPTTSPPSPSWLIDHNDTSAKSSRSARVTPRTA